MQAILSIAKQDLQSIINNCCEQFTINDSTQKISGILTENAATPPANSSYLGSGISRFRNELIINRSNSKQLKTGDILIRSDDRTYIIEGIEITETKAILSIYQQNEY